MLKAYFNEKAVHQLQTDHNYSIRGDIEESIGRIPTNAKQKHNSYYLVSKKEKERRYLDHVLQLLEDARKTIIADIAQMQIELEKFISGRDEVIDRKNAISKVLDDLREERQIEVGEDGYPKDEKAKSAIKKWEQKTGKKIDINSPEAAETLRYILLDLQHQESELDQKIEKKNSDIQNANEILNELEDDISTAKNNGVVNQTVLDRAKNILESKEELTSKLTEIENEQELNNLETDKAFIDVASDFKF